MRRVDLDSFWPQPRASYFVHVAADSSRGVALCAASVSTGMHPCRGADSDPGDGYEGAVYRAESGLPVGNIIVRYYGITEGGTKLLAGETRTDGQGRHAIRLPPGRYEYTYLGLHGTLTTGVTPLGDGAVEVLPGHRVKWIDPERALGTDNLSPTPESIERDVSFVREEWLAEWSNDDGGAWDWLDVEEIIKETCRKIREAGSLVVRVGFSAGGSKFVRPDLITSLRRVNVPARDLEMSLARLAIAHKNVLAVGNASYLEMLGDARANSAFFGVKSSKTGISAPAGVPFYLAEARIVCISEAAQTAGQNATGKATVWNPQRADNRALRKVPFLSLGGTLAGPVDESGQVKRP